MWYAPRTSVPEVAIGAPAHEGVCGDGGQLLAQREAHGAHGLIELVGV